MSKAMLKERHKDLYEDAKENNDAPFKTRIMFPVTKAQTQLFGPKKVIQENALFNTLQK